MTKNQIQKITLNYLKGNRLMTLATAVKNKPWASTVFFAYDDKFNLYFFSREDTAHCLNIKSNPNVAVAINQDWGKRGFIKGFQMTGKAAKVSKSEYAKLYSLYSKRHPWADKFSDHILYQIKPTKVFHINQKAFGHFFRVEIV